MTRKRLTRLLLAALAVIPGCRPLAARVAIPFLYEPASLPAERQLLDVAYWNGGGADGDKHRLDLFLPAESAGRGWPVLLFVHGGGWRTGDRSLEVAGADVYRNIGRFFAERGVGVASISYRLQPEVDWRAQVADVARAFDWVQREIGQYGGDPRAVFLAGHSAGAQLAAHVAFGTPAELADAPEPAHPACGLIAVSGAGYDLADEQTYRLGADPEYYAARFADSDADTDWQREASPVTRVDGAAPPALVLYAGGEWASLQHQARVLDRALREAGVASEVVVVPGEDHERIVLTLSHPEKAATPAMLDFIRKTACVG